MVEKWRWTLLGICFVLCGSSGDSSRDPGDSLHRISSLKTGLVRTFFRQNMDRPRKFILRVKDRADLEKIPRTGNRSAVFRSFDQSYIFAGEEIYRVGENPKSVEKTVDRRDFRPEEEPILFRNHFHRESDSQKLWFTVICYRKGYCRVFVSAEEGTDLFDQRIDAGAAPSDVRFFLDEEELLLIIVKDPCLVYRWTGTYFDQQDVLDTTGAGSVAAFRSGKNSVFVVAQNLGPQKVRSKVYVRKNKRTELVQLLPTMNALKAEPFTVKIGEEFYHLVFVLSETTPSSIYWWNGKELSLWRSVDEIFGNGIVHVDHVFSETFLFFSNKNEIRVYRFTASDLDPVLTMSFDSDVVDLDLKPENGGLPLLVVLTGVDSDPFLKVSLLSLEKVYLPVAENQETKRDEILQCFKQLEERLKKRETKLLESEKFAEALSRVREPVRATFLNAEKTVVGKSDVGHLVTNPSDEKSVLTLTELKRDIAGLKSETESESGPFHGFQPTDKIYRVREETKLGKLKANKVLVEKSFRAGNFLSLTKNQNLGRTKAGKLSAEDLKISTVRGIQVRDILIKNGRRQEITGEQTLQGLKAGNVRFGGGGKINGILFSELVTNADAGNRVTGKKTFSKFKTQNLLVEKINGIASRDWSSKILPGFNNKSDRDAPLRFSRLSVDDLKVSYLNDVPWEELKKSLFSSEDGDELSGNLNCTGKTKVASLRADKINGMSPEEFLTLTTDQKLNCGLKGPSAKAKKLKPKSVDGANDAHLKELLGNRVSSDGRNAAGDGEKITGSLKVSKVVFKNFANVSGRSIDPETMNHVFYSKKDDQEIRIPVHFKKTVTVREGLESQKIAGTPFDTLAFTNGSILLQTELIFEKATVLGNVTSSEKATRNVNLGTVGSNGAKSTGENVISGRKVFVGPVSAKMLRSRFVGGTETSKLFLPRENYETEEFVVNGDASVRRQTQIKELNGLLFDEKVSDVVVTDDPSHLEYGNHSSLLVKYLDVEKLNDAATSSGDDVFRRSRVDLTVEGNVFTPEIQTETVNGIGFDEYVRRIVRKSEKGVPIRGGKIFLEKVVAVGDLNGTVDGHDVADFERKALSKIKGQNVTGVYRVDDAKANALFAETVDGIKTDNLIFQDDLNVPKIDSDLVFSDLIVAGNVRSLDFMNGCDLNKIVEKNLETIQDFQSLDAKEDLIWRDSESGDLSRLFSDAVTPDGDDETVTGRVLFRGRVVADSVDTEFHVNDVDLKSVADNALYRSLPKQEISNGVVFKGTVSAENVLVLNDSIVDLIDGVDILDLDSKIVKKDADVEIAGRKEFQNGFSTENLSAGRIDGADTEAIIFYDDPKVLPSTIFEALKVSERLEVKKVDDVDLEDLAGERWCKTKDETVLGNVTVKGNVYLRSDARVSAIDDVQIASVLPLAGGEPKTVSGKVRFRSEISVDGNIGSEKVDGNDLASFKRDGFSKDENVDISGNLIFSEEIEINGDVRVLNEITEEPADRETNQETSQRKEMEKILEKGKKLSGPSIFMYLEEISTFELDYFRIDGSDLVDRGDSVEITIKGFKKDSCGLPEDCLCPVQTRVSVSPEGKPSTEKNFPRKFHFFDRGSGLEAKLETSTVSYDSSCTRTGGAENEETVLIWKGSGSSGKAELGRGYVDDVRFFRLGDSVYVVVSYISVPEGLATVVYEATTSDGKVTEVDRVRDSRAFDVFWTSEGIVMVTGNASEDSVAVRRFVESENKFSLLRTVPTHGATAVKSIRHKKENFIFVVQKRSWPLLILKYDPTEDNYRVQQKRDTAETDLATDFLSVAVVSTSESKTQDENGDLFLGIVLSDESFGLFEYKHVEGFVETSVQEQDNVKLLQPFCISSQQYLMAVSSNQSSKIYKFAKEGRTFR